MPRIARLWLAGTSVLVLLSGSSAQSGSATNEKIFPAAGDVKRLEPDNRTVVIRHDAITNYMPAMTMPFKVKDRNELAGVRAGDRISFRLHVTENESWIDRIVRTQPAELSTNGAPANLSTATAPVLRAKHPLLEFAFTNELGQAVTLGGYRGQALAITFVFTRCPIPEYCPQLSKNFQEASRKLLAMPNAPTNWHLLSVTFDPEYDTASVLKAYGERYQYDPGHWSFLTGPADKIAELARQSGLKYERTGAFFNHDFRTLIVNAGGHLQMVFPVSGDLSDAIVTEIIKAAAETNATAQKPPQ
jgi:protein SCO1/2